MMLPPPMPAMLLLQVGDEDVSPGSAAHQRAFYDRFVLESDEFRNKRLKMLSRVVEAPWLVKVPNKLGRAALRILKWHCGIEMY